MNCANAACSTLAECQTVRYFAFVTASRKPGGATRKPSLNAGGSTFEKDPM